jgi:hypothetical protein
MDDIGGSRPQRAWVVRPGRGPTPPVLIWPLGLVSLTSYSSSGVSHKKNINAPKIPGQFKSEKVAETLKYAKQGFSVMLSYKQNKGDRWKSP